MELQNEQDCNVAEVLDKGGRRANQIDRTGWIKPSWERLIWNRDFYESNGVNTKKPQQADLFLMAEQEAMRDLKKPVEQLLADVHEQGLKSEVATKHVLEAVRRMSSMMAKVAMSNEKLSWKLLSFTLALVFLTIASVRESLDLPTGWVVAALCGAVISLVVAISQVKEWINKIGRRVKRLSWSRPRGN